MILSLLLLYFIGKAFYELAHDYNKSRWGYAILGIISYYAGTFIGGAVLAIIGLLAHSDFPRNQPKIILGLMAIPFGLLGCWLFYRILVGVWNRGIMLKNDDTLDSDLL